VEVSEDTPLDPSFIPNPTQVYITAIPSSSTFVHSEVQQHHKSQRVRLASNLQFAELHTRQLLCC